MISQTQIDELKADTRAWTGLPRSEALPSTNWWTGIMCRAICSMNAAILSSRIRTTPGSGWSRVAIRLLAERRARKRQALLGGYNWQKLEAIRTLLARAKLKGREKIAQRVKKDPRPLWAGRALHTRRSSDDALRVSSSRPGSRRRERCSVLFITSSSGSACGARTWHPAGPGSTIEARLKRIAKQHHLDADRLCSTVGEEGFDYRIADQPQRARGRPSMDFAKRCNRVRVSGRAGPVRRQATRSEYGSAR